MPLPWTREGSSFGFGSGGAHLPQPSWFADASVQAEEGDPASTLSLYRRALALRHELLALERLEWVETGRGDVLRFRRPNGWEVVTVFGSAPLALSFVPGQRVVLSSTPLDGDTVPGLASAAVSLPGPPPTIGIVVSDTLRSLSGGTDIGGGESSTGAASETPLAHRVGDAHDTPR